METTPLTLQIVDFNTKEMQEELQKLGLKVNHHEENIRFLKSEIDTIEESIADLRIKLGKGAAVSNNDISFQEAEQHTVQSILNQDKTAARVICELKNRHYLQASKMPLMKDVLGVVATLGKVNDDNLSSLLSEYLGVDNMLGLVCKTYDGVKVLETYDKEGAIDKSSGIHGLGRSIGKFLDGRFTVFCLENMRPFSGDVMMDDPQRTLILHKPRLPSGESPPGFLGFAVNMIHMDQMYLSCLTSSGHGLRETLFYSLFSHLQVYKTRADLRRAIPLINDGAISLDGGILKPNGSFCLGDRKNVQVKFTVTLSLGVSNFTETIIEMEEQVKRKNWEKERLVEDMRREEGLLNQVKDLFSKQKQQLMDYLTQPPVSKEMTALPDLLERYYDDQHRCHSWLASDVDVPPTFTLRAPRSHWHLDERFVPLLRDSGLLPFARMMCTGHSFTLDASLLTALVDRWRPETHTFHFRWGEMTVTLQDVSMITGLPISGVAIVPPPKRGDWREHLAARFGVEIPKTDKGQLPRGVPLNWLRRFETCPNGADDEVVRTHLVAYLLFLFGWYMFPTSHGNIVYPSYIHLAEALADAPLGNAPQYSWGSAVLCATYRGLCDATARKKGKEPILNVCHTLLQLWSWEHFSVGRPQIIEPIHPYPRGQSVIDGPTMGTRWTGATFTWARDVSARCYPLYHQEFELLDQQGVIWFPWTNEYIFSVAPLGLSIQCFRDTQYWMTTCHLVFSNMVEPYAPQRVMRQFDLFQTVPPPASRELSKNIHEQDKKGRKDDDWTATQSTWKDMWDKSAAQEVIHEQRQYDERTYDEYLRWYVPRTRARLTCPPPERPATVTHADQLRMGMDRHRASRRDDTFDRALRIRDTTASVLRTGRHHDQSLLHKLNEVYEDAKGIMKNLSCGRADDILSRAFNMSEQRSARPSEAHDTRIASGR